jgi:hypothetical protein
LIAGLDQLFVRAVLRGRGVVDAQALPDRVDVLVVLGLVDPVDAHLRPLTPDVLGRADAVHVVDDRAATER